MDGPPQATGSARPVRRTAPALDRFIDVADVEFPSTSLTVLGHVGKNLVYPLHAHDRPAHAKVVVQRGVHVDGPLLDPPQDSRDVQLLRFARGDCIQHVPRRLLVLRADEYPRDGPIKSVRGSDPPDLRPRRLEDSHHGILPVLSTAMHRHAGRLANHEIIVILLDQFHFGVRNGRLVAVHQMPDPDALSQRGGGFIHDLLPHRSFDTQATVPKRLLVVRP